MNVGFGFFELLIIILVLGFLVVLAVGIVGLLIMSARRGPGQRWTPPQPSGPAQQVHAVGPADQPLDAMARWDGHELEIRSDAKATCRLFEVPLDNLQQCMLTYRLRIQTRDLKSPVYQELWCRVPGKGEFFSRGLNCKVAGTNDWRQIDIPFYVDGGNQVDQVRLNMVFEGPGTIRLRDIEVLSAPVRSA